MLEKLFEKGGIDQEITGILAIYRLIKIIKDSWEFL